MTETKKDLKWEAKRYEPELGQSLFGCPAGDFECPDFVEAGLRHLAYEIERVERNRTQKQYDAPIKNVAGKYNTPVFEMRSYYWGDDEKMAATPNFKCGDFEVRWYKYLGRGMSMNKPIDANRFFLLLDKCLSSVRKKDVVL